MYRLIKLFIIIMQYRTDWLMLKLEPDLGILNSLPFSFPSAVSYKILILLIQMFLCQSRICVSLSSIIDLEI